MEPEPLPLRTKAPPASQEQLQQQQQPPTSPPKATEDELDAALNGQEPTVKNLILAAIGVMKVNLKLNLKKKIYLTFLFLLTRIARLGLTASASATGSIEDMAVALSKSTTYF